MHGGSTFGSALPRTVGCARSKGRRLPWQLERNTAARLWLCGLAGLAGFLLTIFCFYPGYMWWDSNNQYLQARTHSFVYWHPPLMSLTWAVMDRLIPGPAGMLILHNLMFWAGLTLLVYLTRLRSALAPLLILAVGLYPPIFQSLGVVLKDAGMDGALLLGYACLAWAQLRGSRRALVVGLGSLLYGFAIRYNAAAAVAPLSVLAGSAICRCWPREQGWSRWAPFGLAAALLLGFAMVMSQGNSLISDEKLHPSQQILLHDLIAISIQSETILLPPYATSQLPEISVAHLRELYSARDLAPIFWSRVTPHFDEHISDQEFAELVTTWLRTVPTHLNQYLAHRSDVFSHLLAIGVPRVCSPIYTGPIEHSENVLGFSPAGVAVNAELMAWLGGIADSVLFRGWFYLSVSAVLLVGSLLVRRARTLFVVTLSLSGLVYALAYLPLAATCEFRYLWWTMLTTALFPVAALLPSDLTGHQAAVASRKEGQGGA